MSEVLITIVIIGIIAAITIPAVSKASQKFFLRNQFKKAYSTILQAYNNTVSVFASYPECYVYGGGTRKSSECAEFWNTFISKLSVSKVCRGNALRDGCIPEYSESSFISSSSSCRALSYPYIANNRTVYVLADGQIFHNAETWPYFITDINGHKGPNKLGYDLFYVEIRMVGGKPGFYGGDSAGCRGTMAEGGVTFHEMIKESFANSPE